MSEMHHDAHYTSVAIALHWIIAAFVLVNITIGYGVGFLEEGSPTEGLAMVLHKSAGVTVLGLTMLRIVWRITHRPVPPTPGTPRIERALARISHALFYALLMLLPLSGWLLTSYFPERHAIVWFGLWELPFLPVEPAMPTAIQWFERHELLALITSALVIVHLAAVIKHRFFDRRDVLHRMMPRFRLRASS